MYKKPVIVNLCGCFLCIHNDYAIDVDNILKIVKYNGEDECYLNITQINNHIELLKFASEKDRDISFTRILACLSYYRR